MTLRAAICASISSLVISLATALPASAQHKVTLEEEPADTTLINGLAISADLVGIGQLVLSGYGQVEGALRVNLLDRYFPTIELGWGIADKEDEVTLNRYKTNAPFMRLGMDYNISKNKHDVYRVFVGARYAFTSFKFDVSHADVQDPNFGGTSPYHFEGNRSSCHWAELVVGVDAKIWRSLHLGWTARYRQRLAHKHVELGNDWYVPGFGLSGSSTFGGTFNIIFDI